MDKFLRSISFQAISFILLSFILGILTLFWVVKGELEEKMYTLERERLDDFAKEIEYIIKSDFKILFTNFGANKEQYEIAKDASKKQLLLNLETNVKSRDSSFGMIIYENSKVVFQSGVDSIDAGVDIEKSLDFEPFDWRVEFHRDIEHIRKIIDKNILLILNIMLFIAFLNIVVLVVVFRHKVDKPFNIIFSHLRDIKDKKYSKLSLDSSYEIESLCKEIDSMAFSIKKDEEKLEQNYLYIKSILDNQSGIVVLTDGKEIVDVNREMFEYLDEFKNLDEFKKVYSCICYLFEYVDDDSYLKPEFDNKGRWIKVVMENAQNDYKAKIRGNIFKVRANVIGENRYIVVLSDITKLEEYNKNLELLIKKGVEENLQKEKLIMQEKKHAALGELIINIAHHWRQPLGGSMLMLDIVQELIEERGVKDDEISSYCAKISGELEFLSNTISKFNTIYNRVNREPVVVNFENILNIIIDNYKDKLNGISIKLNIEAKTLLSQESDLLRILESLLENSIEAISKENIEHPKIEISTRFEQESFVLEFADNGGGVAQENMEKIFEPYFTTSFKSRGKGLGLYLLKNILEIKYSGKIEVKNIDKGATFIVELKDAKPSNINKTPLKT